MTVTAEPTLTRRQREVLALYIEGRSVNAIATELQCSRWTIRAHISQIAKKINSPLPPSRRVLLYGADLLSEGS